jgi:F1F0 ATPase subunit 2
MYEIWTILLCVLLGAALGLIFFGGLYWTVNKALSSQHAALWFIGSLLIRMGIVLAGFYWMGGDAWQRYLAGFIGFFIARIAVVRLTCMICSKAEEVNHAP